MSRTLTVAAVQMASGSWQAEHNMDRAERLIRQAAAAGAQLVLCPELFMQPYFCIDQHVDHLQLAQPFEGHPGIARFARLAGELGVVIPIGFFERAGNAAYNSIAVADSDGRVLGVYRKTHIPDGPGYTEKFYFTPGDTGFKVWDTRVGKIGIGICWDQWYPETARSLALMGAEVLCFPTIIGSEPFSADYDSSGHWQRTMQGHAAANMLPVIAANRIGFEQGQSCALTFYGRSFIAGPRGEILASAEDQETILTQSFDLARLRRDRAGWGLFRDRRPDLYTALMTLDGQSWSD